MQGNKDIREQDSHIPMCSGAELVRRKAQKSTYLWLLPCWLQHKHKEGSQRGQTEGVRTLQASAPPRLAGGSERCKACSLLPCAPYCSVTRVGLSPSLRLSYDSHFRFCKTGLMGSSFQPHLPLVWRATLTCPGGTHIPLSPRSLADTTPWSQPAMKECNTIS